MPSQLTEKVRAKYPGVYDDLDDQVLEKQVLAKHPEYADLAETPKDIHAQLVKANETPLNESTSTRGGYLTTAAAKSFGNTMLETGKGILEGPWEALKAGMQAKAEREAEWTRHANDPIKLITPSQIKAGVGDLVGGAVETVKGLPAQMSDPRTGGRMIGTLALPMAAEYGGPVVGRALTAAAESPLPGRLIRATGAGTWNAAKNTPLVGRPIAAFARGAGRSWQGSAPAAVTAEAAPGVPGFVKPPTPAMSGLEVTKALKLGISPEELQTLTREQILAKLSAADQSAMTTRTLGARPPSPVEPPVSLPPNPTTKPKLSAAETAQYLRNEYGSEQGGRMLYGTKGAGRPNVLAPAERQANIKRLAPQTQSSLPDSVTRELRDKVRLMTPTQAAEYANLAPNKLMRQYLLDLMKSH